MDVLFVNKIVEMKNILLVSILFFLIIGIGRTQTTETTEVTVANNYFNVLYRGLENPIRITAENCPCDQLFVKATNSTLTGTGCSYTLMPGLENSSILTAFREIEGDTFELYKYEFRVKNIPVPAAYFGGVTGTNSTINWHSLNASSGVIGRHENFDPLVEIRVNQFVFTAINSKGEKFNTNCYSAAVTDEIKRIISLLDSGSYIIISNIRASSSEGFEWILDNIEFRLVK